MLSRPSTALRAPRVDRADFVISVDLAVGRVAVTGRLDRGTAHLLQDALSTLLHAQHMRWQLDVSELTDVDDAGLRAVGAAYRRALRHGRHLTLQGASPPLREALTRLRLDRHILGDRMAPAGSSVSLLPHSTAHDGGLPVTPAGTPQAAAGGL
jgi:anti-anti-sigma regulatory factor